MIWAVVAGWFVWLAKFVSCSIAVWGSSPNVRLVDRDGPNHFQGRVEVFHSGDGVSGWFTICDDNWDYRDATVVCRQLGFSGSAAVYYGSYFGAGSGRIAMDEVRCSGREQRLQDCQFDGWFKHDCKHNEDAGVRCRVHQPASRRMIPVRLVNGCSEADGIVEIHHSGRWGAIDSERFNKESAYVICGQLGYPRGEIGTCNSTKCTVYEGSIIASGFICTGREINLSRCSLMFWGPFGSKTRHNASKPAYLRCFTPLVNASTVPVQPPFLQIRLRGGRGPWEGRVEILNVLNRHSGQWSPLCDHDWSQYTGNVMCRQLGYGTASRVYGGSNFGRGVGHTYNYVFECKGNELTLEDCKHHEVGWYSCRHYEEAGVECYRPRKATQTVRISGASTYTRGFSGFLEIKVHEGNHWYRVCDEGWGLSQARVVCRELDLGFGQLGKRQPLSRAVHPNITYANVHYECTGDEFQLSDCRAIMLTSAIYEQKLAKGYNITRAFPPEEDRCASGFAWVECSPNLPDLVPDVGELRRTLHGYPHVIGVAAMPCALEEDCFAPSAKKYASSYQHKRILLRFTTRVLNLGRAPFIPHLTRDKWEWHSCHQHYHSFEAFSIYRIIDRNGRQVGHGHKAGFCLEDRDCEERGPPPLVYYNCRGGHGGRQGISVNCADTYRRELDCQWVDLTDIPYGRYRLIIDVNPHRRVAETDFSNNVIYCNFSYLSEWWIVTVTDCGVYSN